MGVGRSGREVVDRVAINDPKPSSLLHTHHQVFSRKCYYMYIACICMLYVHVHVCVREVEVCTGA